MAQGKRRNLTILWPLKRASKVSPNFNHLLISR
jgi:hypothetical protein